MDPEFLEEFNACYAEWACDSLVWGENLSNWEPNEEYKKYENEDFNIPF